MIKFHRGGVQTRACATSGWEGGVEQYLADQHSHFAHKDAFFVCFLLNCFQLMALPSVFRIFISVTVTLG